MCLPFFLAAPGSMFRMVVVDQLERGEANGGGLEDVCREFSAWQRSAAEPGHRSWLLVGAAVLLCALAVVGAVLDRAWLVAALLIAIVTLLIAAPKLLRALRGLRRGTTARPGGSRFGRAGHAGRRSRPDELPGALRRPAGALTVALGIVVVPIAAFVSVVAGLHRGTPFPAAALGRAAASSRCVTADSPVVLIQMDLLSRDLERGCRVWVDVTGLTYDTADVRRPDGKPGCHASLNRPWQQALSGYLLSGNATVLVRSRGGRLRPGHRPHDRAPTRAGPTRRRPSPCGRFLLAAPGTVS